jgi:hypothetical protein
MLRPSQSSRRAVQIVSANRFVASRGSGQRGRYGVCPTGTPVTRFPALQRDVGTPGRQDQRPPDVVLTTGFRQCHSYCDRVRSKAVPMAAKPRSRTPAATSARPQACSVSARRALETDHAHRGGRVCRGAVPQPTAVVGAPALGGGVREQRTRMRAASRDRDRGNETALRIARAKTPTTSGVIGRTSKTRPHVRAAGTGRMSTNNTAHPCGE